MLRALRPWHYIGTAVVLLALGSGVASGGFGLISSQLSPVKRLTSCLHHHHVKPAEIEGALGNPLSLVSDAESHNERRVRQAARKVKLTSHQESAAITCMRRLRL